MARVWAQSSWVSWGRIWSMAVCLKTPKRMPKTPPLSMDKSMLRMEALQVSVRTAGCPSRVLSTCAQTDHSHYFPLPLLA